MQLKDLNCMITYRCSANILQLKVQRPYMVKGNNRGTSIRVSWQFVTSHEKKC